MPASRVRFSVLVLLFLVTVLISSLSWHFFEQPFLAWKKALANRTTRPALPVGSYVTN